MKTGDLVMIYHDPITMTKPEGRAKLLVRRGVIGLHEGHSLVLWNVQFMDDKFHALKLIYDKE